MNEIGLLEIAGRIALAAALGGVLGLEREFDGQEAGFRTHLLLALGAAVFSIASVAAFTGFVEPTATTNVRVDVTRIASYVAAGIGFICGGAILKHGGAVRGITTAASLWTAAAIGLSAGLGAWFLAIASTVIALVALLLLKPVSLWISDRSSPAESDLLIEVRTATDPARVVGVIKAHDALRITSCRLHTRSDGSHDVHVQAAVTAKRDDRSDVICDLSEQLRGDAVTLEMRSVDATADTSDGAHPTIAARTDAPTRRR